MNNSKKRTYEKPEIKSFVLTKKTGTSVVGRNCGNPLFNYDFRPATEKDIKRDKEKSLTENSEIADK